MTQTTAWTIPGLIPGGLSTLDGQPSAASSAFLLDVLLSVADGAPALGAFPFGPPRDVLYLALRDSDRSLQGRIKALRGDEPFPDGFGYLKSVAPGAIPDVAAGWMDVHPGTAIIAIDRMLNGENPALQHVEALAAIANAYVDLTIIVVTGTAANAMTPASSIEFANVTPRAATVKVGVRRLRLDLDGSRWVFGAQL